MMKKQVITTFQKTFDRGLSRQQEKIGDVASMSSWEWEKDQRLWLWQVPKSNNEREMEG